MSDDRRTGQEEYLYKDTRCCLNPCSVKDCPEPICVFDYPGGMRAYLKQQEMRKLLDDGMSFEQVALALNIGIDAVQRRFNKAKKVLNV